MITYKEKITVTNSEADFRRVMRPSAALNVIQNISGVNSRQLGLDNVILAEKGMGWVLSKIRLNINRLPSADEEIICETWANPPKRFEYERCCRFCDTNGNELFTSRARWCILHLSDGRLVPSTQVTYPEKFDFRTDFTMDTLPKLNGDGEWQKMFPQVIRLSLIDVNIHMNNTRYADFVMDCFSREEYSAMKINSFQLDFLSQVREGEELTLFRVKEDGGFRIKGESNGKTAFIAEIRAE